MEIPLDKFQLVPVANGEESEKKDEIYAYRTREEVLGGERTVVVTYERKLYERNLRTFVKGIEKRNKEFEALESKIGRRRYRTKSAIEQKAEKIQAKAPEGLFDVAVGGEEGQVTLTYAVNRTAYDEKRKSFGKTILFTDNHEWSTEQIIKVHAFCCVLALMLLLLLKRKLRRAGVELSLERMLEELSEVQLSVIKFYDVKKRLCLLNDMNEEQRAMFDVLGLKRYQKLVYMKLPQVH
jgi:transposase